MEESLPTWSPHHSSVRHVTVQERHHEVASMSFIQTTYPPIIGSAA